MPYIRLSILLGSMFCAAGTAAGATTLFLNGGASSVSIFDGSTLTEESYVGAPHQTRSVALSPDGTTAYIATGGIVVVSAATRAVIGRLPSNNAAILRLSPDGSRLYAANVNGSVWVYDTATGAVIKRIPFVVPSAQVYAVADLTVSADGTLIGMGSVESMCGDDGCPAGAPPAIITEIDGGSNALIRRIPVAWVLSLAIAGDGTFLYVADGSGIAELDAATGATTGTIAFPANKLALDAAAARLYAGSSSKPYTLGIFSVTNGSSLTQVAMTAPVTKIAFSPDHATVYTGGCLTSGQIPSPCVLNGTATATGLVLSAGSLFGPPADLAVTPDSSKLWVANGSPEEVTAVDTSTNRTIGEVEANYSVGSMVVTPTGNKVYTANEDGTISVIDGQTFARLKVLQAASQDYNVIGANSVSPDGQRAYIALDQLQVLDTSSDEIVGTIPELPFGSTVSPDSQTVYTFNADYDEPANSYQLSVTSYAAKTLEPIGELTFLNGQLPTQLFVSPDRSTLYLVAGLKTFVIAASELQGLGTITQASCLDAAFSNDGKTIYCLDQPDDTTQPDLILAIGTATGKVKRTYSVGEWGFGYLALTPDGSKLYVSLSLPSGSIPGILEQIDLATGTIRFVNTTLSGTLAIQ